MKLAASLDYVYISSAKATVAPIEATQTQVKGDNFILSTLQSIVPTIQHLSGRYLNLVQVANAINVWIVKLGTKYGDRVIWGGPPFHLDATDGRSLSEDSRGWLLELLKTYSNSETISINEEAVGKLFPAEFMARLDPLTRDDLDDGINCILHAMPTPGTMVLLRAAENAVRKYSKKLTGNPTEKASGGDILEELEKRPGVRKSILGFLHYLKDKRNEAQHPDKRFKQEEAERMLIQVKGLLDELDISVS